MIFGEQPFRDRRAFLGSCATPLLMLWRPPDAVARQDTPITVERAVDAYLGGDSRLAVRLLEILPDAIRGLADDTFKRWVRQALPIKPIPGEADDSGEETTSRAGAHLRRATVRRLQGTAALILEILLPLSGAGGYEDTRRALESIAIDALGHAARFENLDLLPHDRAGRRAEELRRALAHFRARWYVAFLQVLVNMQRRKDALVIVARITLPRDDVRALAEMRFLRGLLDESVVRFNLSTRPDGIHVPDGLAITDPSSAMLSVGKRYDAARYWFRQALDARADHLEARLHLGRLELEGGRHAQALETLAPLDVPTVAPAWRGLARLFMAESHAGSGAHDAAREGFEHALKIAEVRQSALVALTTLSLRDGQLSDAADLTRAFDVGAADDDGADAWTAYLSGRRENSEAVLALLREVLLS